MIRMLLAVTITVTGLATMSCKSDGTNKPPAEARGALEAREVAERPAPMEKPAPAERAPPPEPREPAPGHGW